MGSPAVKACMPCQGRGTCTVCMGESLRLGTFPVSTKAVKTSKAQAEVRPSDAPACCWWRETQVCICSWVDIRPSCGVPMDVRKTTALTQAFIEWA